VKGRLRGLQPRKWQAEARRAVKEEKKGSGRGLGGRQRAAEGKEGSRRGLGKGSGSQK